jgi:hypothetical protein
MKSTICCGKSVYKLLSREKVLDHREECRGSV